MASKRRSERGAVAVFVAVALVALVGMVAFVLNLGHRWDTEAELQNAADAAALAGARELNGTLAPISAGLPEISAIDFAGRHSTEVQARVPVAIGRVDVTLGHWDPFATNPATAFTPLVATNEEQAWNVNAVRVRTGRETSRGNPLQVWMSAFLGDLRTQDVTAEAIAVNGGPCDMACPTVPFAFFDCGLFEDYVLNCGTVVSMHDEPVSATAASDPTDSVGFSGLSSDSGTANTATYKSILNGACVPTVTDQPIYVSNGNQFNAVCAGLSARIGQTVQAPVVHGECPPKFIQDHPVLGFATFRIEAVGCGASKYISFKLMCDEQPPPSNRTGCGFFYTGQLEPKLAR